MADPEIDYDSDLEMRSEIERDAQSTQCCPMDTYITDLDGHLRPACTCPDFCECMCLDCACTEWLGEEFY